LLKIDVEMHEPEVLEGAQRVINRARPAILVEVLSADIGRRVSEKLPSYVFFEIAEGDGLHRCNRFEDREDRNFLALPEDDPRVPLIGSWMEEAAFYRLAKR
jgi:hypothetical protein